MVLLEALVLFNDPFIAGEVHSDSAEGLQLLYIMFRVSFMVSVSGVPSTTAVAVTITISHLTTTTTTTTGPTSILLVINTRRSS